MVRQIISWLKNKLTELRFWWVKKRIKAGRDYEVSNGEVDNIKIDVLTGRYAGVVYEVGKIEIHDEGTVEFYTIVREVPAGVDTTEKKFTSFTTNIFRQLIDDAVREAKAIIDEDRTTNTLQLDEERDFHEESLAVPEKRVPARKPRKKVISADKGTHTKVQQATKRSRAKNRTTGKK